MTSLPKPKLLQVCLLLKPLKPTEKQERTTTASAANAVHATVTAVTAANAEVSAPIAKQKAIHRNNWVLTTNLLVNLRTVARAQELPVMRKHRTQTLQLPTHQRHASACRKFSTSACHCQSCKQLHKAVVWNGSIQTQRASLRCKRPLRQSPSPSMCHASVQHLWC